MQILLVDDDIRSLSGLHRFLKLSGHDCDALDSPVEALSLYQRKHHELVISDLKMPGIDGIELLQQIRRCNPQSHVIIISGYANDQTAAFVLQQGALALLSKPVDLEEILSIIETLETSPS
ncbi:MAG TPA: response regulator [Patescibacteria group bacterium]|nr:response regulator [Patescibacteria group bacterium]